MTQLVLSDDLIEITAEINIYKQQAGQAVFEIGKRLKHVKENDLAHGQFGEWLKSCGLDSRHAYRYIQAYEQFSPTSGNLSTSKIFEMISLPESVDRQEFIETSHIIPSTNEEKKVADMTVKQLREVTQKLKEAENQANHWQAVAKSAQNQPPRVSIQAPADYLELKQQAASAQELNNKVVVLERNKRLMELEYQEKVTAQDNNQAAVRELRKSFKNILSFTMTEQTSALFHYSTIEGHKEAQETVESFLNQFDEQVREIFAVWKSRIEI